MLAMLAAVGSLLGGLGSSVLAPVLGYFTSKDTITLQGFQAATAADVGQYEAYLNAQTEIETLKASQNMWFGARLISLAGGGLTVFYFGSIVLDSMFHFGWAIAKLPSPWDEHAWQILVSFFLVTPAAPVLSAVTAWLHRK